MRKSLEREQDLLRLFNEKVAKLDRLRFTQSVREKKVGFTINVTGDGGVALLSCDLLARYHARSNAESTFSS